MATKKGFVERITDDKVRAMLALIPGNVFRLLNDAIILHQNESYSSAYALATYALEELGKAFVLIDLLKPGANLDYKERLALLNKAFSDHTNKQREALTFISSAIEDIKDNATYHSYLWGISNKYDDAKLSTIAQRIEHTFRKVELRKRRSIYVDLDANLNTTYPGIDRNGSCDIIDTCLDALIILMVSANSSTKYPWLGEILYSMGFEHIPPPVEEIVDASREFNQDRFEALINEAFGKSVN